METRLLESFSIKDNRRSQRVAINVPIVIEGLDIISGPFSESTRMLVVNAHGALVHLEACVGVGQLLTIWHSKTGEELFCRTVRLGSDGAGNQEAGLEFLHPAPDFWRSTLPPANWQPATDQAGRHVNVARASSLDRGRKSQYSANLSPFVSRVTRSCDELRCFSTEPGGTSEVRGVLPC